MSFEQWKYALAGELERYLGMLPGDGDTYIKTTGDECWREMYDDGLSPTDAAEQEASASAH